MNELDTSALISQHLTELSVRGLVATIETLIRDHVLDHGLRLPAIRSLADDLGISPTTVATAWTQLARDGYVEAFGRRGTFVKAEEFQAHTPRRWQFYDDIAAYRIDLATGVPDPELLPDPLKALRAMAPVRTISYLDSPVYGPLRDALNPYLSSWMTESQWSMTVVDGALEGLDRTLDSLPATVRAVAVEEPAFPALYDLVEVHGLRIIGVALDSQGIVPEALSAVIERRGVGALLTQPRAQNPTGISTTRTRRDEIAAVLSRAPDIFVIEDDHSGLLCSAPLHSLGEVLGPDRCAYVLSFSKSHGPDLRLGALFSGPARTEMIERRRALGPSWSSKLLQAALTEMLTSQEVQDTVAGARESYKLRRHAFASIFAVNADTTDGINFWAPTDDAISLLVHLAHEKIRVAPGTNFYLGGRSAESRIRITLGDPWTPFSEVSQILGESLARFGPIGSYR